MRRSPSANTSAMAFAMAAEVRELESEAAEAVADAPVDVDAMAGNSLLTGATGAGEGARDATRDDGCEDEVAVLLGRRERDICLGVLLAE